METFSANHAGVAMLAPDHFYDPGARDPRFSVVLLLHSLGAAVSEIPRDSRCAACRRSLRRSSLPHRRETNVGGSGEGIVRFDTRQELEDAVAEGRVSLGYDQVGLVQETLAGKYLYAIQVHLTGETFDVCPADICQTTRGESLNACVVEAVKAGLKVENYQPPASVISAIERIVAAAGIDVGGIEYVVDDRDGQLYYYDVNALSNFVADAPRVIGFDPFANLVDFVAAELAHVQ